MQPGDRAAFRRRAAFEAEGQPRREGERISRGRTERMEPERVAVIPSVGAGQGDGSGGTAKATGPFCPAWGAVGG